MTDNPNLIAAYDQLLKVEQDGRKRQSEKAHYDQLTQIAHYQRAQVYGMDVESYRDALKNPAFAATERKPILRCVLELDVNAPPEEPEIEWPGR